MEQRDYLKDQVEEMGRVLGKVLADFLGLKNTGKVTEGIKLANQAFKSQLDIEPNLLLSLTKEELKQYCLARKLNATHLDHLSNYLQEVGEFNRNTDNEYGMKCLTTALLLLTLSDELSNSLSFERIERKNHLSTLLHS